MNDLEKNNEAFENIKHVDENGIEFWYARELQGVLDYKEWRKFENVIKKAIDACENSDISSFDHFVGTDKMIQMPKGATKNIKDYKLTRYACYLIAQNGERVSCTHLVYNSKLISKDGKSYLTDT